MTKERQHRTAVMILACLLLIAGAGVLASPASAGGSTWYFDRPSYEAGDVVRAGAAVSWGHNVDLGTPERGPYGVWIVPWEQFAAGVVPDSLAVQIESARYVTDVRIEVGPQEINGIRYGPNVARVEFRLPPVAPGLYSLLHCNYPCTTTLGDITWGVFWVGTPDPGAPSTSGQTPVPTGTSPPTTAVVPPTIAVLPATTVALRPTTEGVKAVHRSDDPIESDGLLAPVLVVGLATVGAGGVLTAARRRH